MKTKYPSKPASHPSPSPRLSGSELQPEGSISIFGSEEKRLTLLIGLLTKRFRAIALYEALLMHALIFFLIGPFRNDWNNSAWIWGQTVAAQAWLLFYKAPPFAFKKCSRPPFLQPPAGARRPLYWNPPASE